MPDPGWGTDAAGFLTSIGVPANLLALATEV
jgi:hypothetical protein